MCSRIYSLDTIYLRTILKNIFTNQQNMFFVNDITATATFIEVTAQVLFAVLKF